MHMIYVILSRLAYEYIRIVLADFAEDLVDVLLLA